MRTALILTPFVGLFALSSGALADPPGAPNYNVKKQKTLSAPARQQAMASPAICATFRSHRRFLAAKYGEHPVFTGQMSAGVQFRLFANATTGSWTMLMVRANGFSCVRGAGKHFRHDVGT